MINSKGQKFPENTSRYSGNYIKPARYTISINCEVSYASVAASKHQVWCLWWIFNGAHISSFPSARCFSLSKLKMVTKNSKQLLPHAGPLCLPLVEKHRNCVQTRVCRVWLLFINTGLNALINCLLICSYLLVNVWWTWILFLDQCFVALKLSGGICWGLLPLNVFQTKLIRLLPFSEFPMFSELGWVLS